MSTRPPVEPNELAEIVRLVTQAVHTRPETAPMFMEIARQVWERYRSTGPSNADLAPILDLFTGDWGGDRATLELFAKWPTMSNSAREIVAGCVDFTTRTDAQKNWTRAWAYRRLERALERLSGRYLTQSEVAQLAAFLARRAALATGRPVASRDSQDAASARLQVIADQFQFLPLDEQQHISALVAALANGTPDAAAERRSAARRLILSFPSNDLEYFAKACITGLSRKLTTEAEQEPAS